MDNDLIFDVGLHHGDDAAYYLSKGFRVVGIEANPQLAERCRQRFAADVSSGRMKVICVGIGETPGEFPFWVHRTHDEWSSFFRNPTWREGEFEQIQVSCVPFRDLLETYGTPFYLKVDIEGADPTVIHALNEAHRPKYVSFEAGPDTVSMLCLLSTLSYDSFKCVNQTVHNAPAESLAYSNEDRRARIARSLRIWKWRATRQLGLDGTAFASLWRSMRRKAASESAGANTAPNREVGWQFAVGSSGPFGEDAPGEWQPLDSVLYNWLHRRFGHFNRGSLVAEAWYDFHARRPD